MLSLNEFKICYCLKIYYSLCPLGLLKIPLRVTPLIVAKVLLSNKHAKPNCFHMIGPAECYLNAERFTRIEEK